MYEHLIIETRIVPAQRQLEPILPLGGAMARTRSATHLVDDGHDVANKRDAVRLLESPNRDGQLHLQPSVFDPDARLTFLDRGKESVGIDLNFVIEYSELGAPRKINFATASKLSQNQNPAGIVGAGENQL